MRIVFVSWSTVGGSGISQRQLAQRLVESGHLVRFVVFDATASAHWITLYDKLSDASVKVTHAPLTQAIQALRDRVGRTTRRKDRDGLWHVHTPVPQNGFLPVLAEFSPDVVVVSSVDRWAWRRINSVCQEWRTPTVLYVREEASLDHLATGSLPSRLLANTPALADMLRERGFDCEFIPSVTDVGTVLVESTREVALAINPIPIKGSELLWELASRLPHIPFVVQDSGMLAGQDLAAVMRQVNASANVEFRKASPPGPHLYADARLLLAPYRVNSRPRVILEAQANGIPILGAALPALEEAIGPGGLLLPVDDVAAWASALDALWNDSTEYARLCHAARQHSARDEMNPDCVAAQFEQFLFELVERGADEAPELN